MDRGETQMGSWRPSSFSFSISPCLRHRLLEFLLHASQKLQISPIVKCASLSFFADRFLPSLRSKVRSGEERNGGSWLLQPLSESNLQLFALASIWISSKIHDSRPLSVKSLKALGDTIISDQHFTAQDFVQAVTLSFLTWVIYALYTLLVLAFVTISHVFAGVGLYGGYEIGASRIVFVFLEDLIIQFSELSKLGALVSLDVCVDIIDLLYETEDTSKLFSSPCSLAASVLIAAYLISVPKQRWEFPLIPWVKFVTNKSEEDITKTVATILVQLLKPEATKQIKKVS